jgi:prephenate dehydrogenase
MEKPFERVAIIGLGLLGGSMARALKATGQVREIVGYGRTQERLDYALEQGIADTVTRDPAQAVRGADFVVVATPVGLIPTLLDQLAGHIEPDAIVIDVGSTKESIVRHAESVLPDSVHFVGCHPMAGSEESGVQASSPILFENALCVVAASARVEVSAVQRVVRMWEGLKARVMVMSPGEHDMLVAAASHLPHLVAVSLCNAINGLSADNEKILPLLAGGFRDTTRVASGSPEMWRDILLSNREPISRVLGQFADSLQFLRARLDNADPGELIDMFHGAKEFRDSIPQRGLGALESDYELLVDVADRPGVLGEITTALGNAGINIKNMNIRHVRDLGGGTLLVVLEKEIDIDRAIALLEKQGFASKRR